MPIQTIAQQLAGTNQSGTPTAGGSYISGLLNLGGQSQVGSGLQAGAAAGAAATPTTTTTAAPAQQPQPDTPYVPPTVSSAPAQTQQNTLAPTTLPAVQIPSAYLPGATFGGSIQQHYQAYATWAQTQGYTPMDYASWSKLSNKFGGIQPAQQSTPQNQPTLPGSVPGADPTQPGVNTNAPIRPDVNPFAFPELLQQFQQMFGGLQLGNPATTGIDPNFRGNIFNALAGGFANGAFGLPGQEADAVGGFLANILGNEVSKQQGRSVEREGLLRGLAEMLAGSSAAGLNEQNLGAASQLTAPGALDSLTAQRRQDLDQTVAATQNNQTNRLRELGVLGQGAASSTPLNALAAQLADVKRRGQLDISNQEEQDRLARLGLSQQVAGSGTDITRALQQDPVNALISSLGQAQNPAVGPFTDLLSQILQLNAGQALAGNNGTFFEQISPLLGAGIGAIGNIGFGQGFGQKKGDE